MKHHKAISNAVKAISALAAVALLSSCGASNSQTSSEDDTESSEISFLYSPYADYAPFFLAKDKGYFEKAGVNVKLIAKGGSSGETYQQVSTGNVTSGGASWGAGLFNAASQGASLSVIASVSKIPESGKNPSPFVLSTKSGIKEVSQLKGKKIGIPGPGGFGLYSVYLALQQSGISLDDVELVNISPADTPTALANGSVAAAWTIEPIASKVIAEGLATEALDVDYQAGTELGTLVFNSSYADEHADSVEKFTAAYLHAVKELNDGGWDDSSNQKIIAKYTELPVETLKSIGLTVQDPTGAIDWSDVKKQEDFFRERGSLDYDGNADLEKLQKQEILSNAQQQESTIWKD